MPRRFFLLILLSVTIAACLGYTLSWLPLDLEQGWKRVAEIYEILGPFGVLLIVIALFVISSVVDMARFNSEAVRLVAIIPRLRFWGRELAPNVGLLGTVSGAGLALRQGAREMSEGLGEAIYTTLFGGVILVGAVLAEGYIRRRLNALDDAPPPARAREDLQPAPARLVDSGA